MFIVRTIRNTQIHCVGRMQSFSVLKRVVYIVLTRLWRVVTWKYRLKKNMDEREVWILHGTKTHLGLRPETMQIYSALERPGIYSWMRLVRKQRSPIAKPRTYLLFQLNCSVSVETLLVAVQIKTVITASIHWNMCLHRSNERQRYFSKYIFGRFRGFSCSRIPDYALFSRPTTLHLLICLWGGQHKRD
jgi:hypothetical protein